MKIKFKFPRDLRDFLILWSTQSFSALGSAMTSFALVVWSYQQQGSALTTAMLSICSYTPYVVMSIFAGALSDRWDKKRTMLFCDGFAALTTVAALMLLKSGGLRIGHIYFINALNGLMNTVQQPASDVAVSLLTPPERIQRVGGLRALSYSLVTVLSPMLATAMLTLFGLDAVMAFDLLTCAVAMIALAGWGAYPPRERECRAGTADIDGGPRGFALFARSHRRNAGDSAAGRHQLHCIHIQCGASGHGAFPAKWR